MKNKMAVRIITTGLMCTVAFGATLPLAADETSPTAVVKDEENKPTKFAGKIEAIDLKAKSFTVDKTVILVGEKTKMTKDGKPIKLDDLKVGTDVHGLMKLNSDKKNEALQLKVGPKKNEAPEPSEVK